MKLRLISVGKLPWYRQGEPLAFFYTPRLGLPYLAAVTPLEWDVDILDGVQADEINFDEPADLVGFSILTPFAEASYRAADAYRKRRVPVVMGGVHPTLLPEEAKRHADAVVIGEGEEAWRVLLRDLAAGRLKDFYGPVSVRFDALPTPKYSLLRNVAGYAVASAIQLVRGCPHGRECRFCTVPRVFGNTYRTIPVEKAVKEILVCREASGVAGVNVAACCALNHREYMRDFARAIEPMQVRWCGGALLHRLDDAPFLATLNKAGCEVIYTESEAPSRRKDPRKFATYCDVVAKIHDHGMKISYNFTLGLDSDGKEILEDTLSFIETAGLSRELCALQLFTPWPDTEAYRELDRAGRILDRDWTHYDNTRVVFQPLGMTVEELKALCSRPGGQA